MAERSDSHTMILIQAGAAAAAVPCAVLLTGLAAALRLGLDATFDFSSPKTSMAIAYVAPHLPIFAAIFLLYRRQSEQTRDQRHRLIDAHTPLTMLVLFAALGAGLAASLFLSKGGLLLLNGVLGEQLFGINDALPSTMLFGVLYIGAMNFLPPAVFFRRRKTRGDSALTES